MHPYAVELLLDAPYPRCTEQAHHTNATLQASTNSTWQSIVTSANDNAYRIATGLNIATFNALYQRFYVALDSLIRSNRCSSMLRLLRFVGDDAVLVTSLSLLPDALNADADCETVDPRSITSSSINSLYAISSITSASILSVFTTFPANSIAACMSCARLTNGSGGTLPISYNTRHNKNKQINYHGYIVCQ